MATPETFESVLRITAGLLIRLRDSNAEVDFHILQGETHRLRHRPDYDAALDHLALLEKRPVKELERNLSSVRPLAHTYLLSDCPREYWEEAARSVFPRSVCIDTAGLSTRPLAVSPRLRRVS